MKTDTLQDTVEQLTQQDFPHYHTAQRLIQSQQINQKKILNIHNQIRSNERYLENLTQQFNLLTTTAPLHEKTQQEITTIKHKLKLQQQQLHQCSQLLAQDNTRLIQLNSTLNIRLFLIKVDYEHNITMSPGCSTPFPVDHLTSWELNYSFDLSSTPLEFEINAHLSHFKLSHHESINTRCKLNYLKPGKPSHYGLIPLDRVISFSEKTLFRTEDSEFLLKQMIQQLYHYHKKGITHGALSLKHFKLINTIDNRLSLHIDSFYKKGLSILNAIQKPDPHYTQLLNTLHSVLLKKSLHSSFKFSNTLFTTADFPKLSQLLQLTQLLYTTDSYFEPEELKKTIKELSKLIHSPPIADTAYRKGLQQLSREFNSIFPHLTRLNDPECQNIISSLGHFRSSALLKKTQFTEKTNHYKILNNLRYHLEKLLVFLESRSNTSASPFLLNSVLTLINNPLFNHHGRATDLLKLKNYLQDILNTFKQHVKNDKIALANIIQTIFTHEKTTPTSSSVSQSDSSDEESGLQSTPQEKVSLDQKCFPANAHDIAFILLKENIPAQEIIEAIEDKDDMIQDIRRSPTTLPPNEMETAFFTLNVREYRRNSPIVFSPTAANKTSHN